MQDGRSRVTVVGERKRIDVAVPSAAPIGEYVAGLAELCGQTRRGVMPPAWSLAPAGTPALPLGASLAEAGIADGQVLYLHDVARDLGASPAVDDIDEMVIGEAQRLRDSGLPRGIVVIGLGLAWLTAAAAFLFMDHRAEIPVAVSLVVGALLLLSTAWALELRRAGVPSAVCLAMSLASLPCLGSAGGLLGHALGGSHFIWLGAVVGCNAGAILTLVATPEAVVFALVLPLTFAGILTPTLLAVEATPGQAAVAVTLVALGLLALARPAAAAITVFVHRARSTSGIGQVTTEVLIESRQLVAVVVAAPVLALAVALVILAQAGGVFDIALAAVASIALALRARQAIVRLEIALLALGAAVGAFAVLASVLARVGGVWWTPIIMVGFGLLLVGIGSGSTLAADPEHPGGEPVELGPPRRRTLDTLGITMSVISAPLALGAFGVFDQLIAIGRGILA
jgi:ESX secretion system protein EccD